GPYLGAGGDDGDVRRPLARDPPRAARCAPHERDRVARERDPGGAGVRRHIRRRHHPRPARREGERRRGYRIPDPPPRCRLHSRDDRGAHRPRYALRRPAPEPRGARGRDVITPVEQFTEEERARLAPHFTNLDRPVFALVNLPETVKGALFARYSRYSGTVRRLYLEEFAEDMDAGARPFDGAEGERAAKLYERVFLGYGDDSIAQVGGAHIACEWVSNVLTKVLQRGRLAASLEQSTRYIPYDKPLPEDAGGGYRYYRDDGLGPQFGAAMDELFAIYSRSLEQVEAWAAERWPRGD